MPAPDLQPERAAALNELLDQALERPEAERAAWLAQLPAAHDDLKPHLHDLLSRVAEIETADFLGNLPPFGLASEHARLDDPEIEVGTLVGPYRLLRALGSGGMGSVWLAERIDGLLKRQVALKFPHVAWPQAHLAQRMERERDILAALEHPNIARLYDAGLSSGGRPFLALEYIDGRPIDEYCRSADGSPRLDVASRVRLFLQVARAVAYAHGKLVLHRDLKPGNVLVTADGAAHLLDFGIAKLLAEGEARETRLTEFSGRALSPDFASPEQIRGEPLSVASDIYSLGVVLYELLAGARPYRLTRNSRGELEEAILFADSRRPSEIAAPGDRRALRGELDTIVLQAMKKAPADRYQTAYALIDDLERALDGRPVAAQADTMAYRAGKFVRRHKLAVAASVLLALALTAGAVGTTVGMLRARRAEAEARTEAATAERYSSFLVNMFEVAAPEGSKGRAVTAMDILEQGAGRVRKELAAEPALQARLLATIGWVYARQGLYTEARPILDESVAIARATGEEGKLDLARALIRRGENERKSNELDRAESDDREALTILELAYGPNDVRLVPALTELGLLLSISDSEQALHLYRRCYDLLMAAQGDAGGDAPVLLQNIGAMQMRAGRYQEARATLEQAVPRLVLHFGAKDPHIGAVYGNLADVYRKLGDYTHAVELAQRALDVDTAVSGPAHPDVGIDWLKLARCNGKLGNPLLALQQIDNAIEIFDKALPPNHPTRIQAANFKAEFLLELGKRDEARRLLDSFNGIQAPGLDTKRRLLAGLVILAEIERLEGQWPKSRALAERILADPSTSGDRTLEASARWARACALAMQQENVEADHERARALKIETSGGDQTPFPGVFALAKSYACAQDSARALATLREAAAKGFDDPSVMHDPAFAALRELPDFAPVAAAIGPRPRPASPAAH
jgi:tetratricopeptide (TPR) repeat protein/tRNA A-37 threonylcarbamoyl transferase component Bud32